MSCDKGVKQAEKAMRAAGVPARQTHAAWAEGSAAKTCPSEQGNAKRLMLVNPDNSDYNWEQIQELERITGHRYIAAMLRLNWQICELWKAEWDELLRQEGYTSVASVNIEGPEEYDLTGHEGQTMWMD